MIPVLAIPALNRPDLLARCLASLDVPVDRLIVVDNSADGSMGGLPLRANLGVAASWNLAIKLTAQAPWWAFCGVDTEFGPGDLAYLAGVMAAPEARVACLMAFGAFAINRACLDAVGFFDENLHPIYVEDCDYEYRCKLAGVPIIQVPSNTVHLEGGSVTIKEPGTNNAKSFPANHDYFRAKWGGSARGGEAFTTPFDRGGSVRDWTLDPSRLRDLAWSRT